MNRTAIDMLHSSPAILVNRLMIVQALNIERRVNSGDVQTQPCNFKCHIKSSTSHTCANTTLYIHRCRSPFTAQGSEMRGRLEG